jgi:hypothetical protein
MSLLTLILVIVALGILLWLLQSAPFISADVKPFLRWIFLALIVLVILQALGVLTVLQTTRIGR